MGLPYLKLSGRSIELPHSIKTCENYKYLKIMYKLSHRVAVKQVTIFFKNLIFLREKISLSAKKDGNGYK